MIDMQRCAHIAIFGLPNAGKSTLLNALVGEKLAITSPKAHTTRFCVTGIVMQDDAQLIFIDSPGLINQQRSRLQQQMAADIDTALHQADILIHVVDATKPLDAQALPASRPDNKPCLAVVNKVDKLKKEALLPLTAKLADHYQHIFYTNARKGEGLEDLLKTLAALAPTGDWIYPDDQLSTLPQATLAAELTREQLFNRLRQELPYGVTVLHESWAEKGGTLTIHQQILVEKKSQKAIVIGQKGSMLKEIGQAARQEIMQQTGAKKVNLFLHVTVQADWQNQTQASNMFKY